MATVSINCGNCGRGVAARVVAEGTYQEEAIKSIRWLLCPGCGDGSVMTAVGAVYPPAPAGSVVQNVPSDVEQAWREARTAHAVAAYTACEIMCRKILMHVAVDVAGAPGGKSFAEYIDVLVNGGYVTTNLKPVVDVVRTRGNTANHELPASTEQDSLRTLTITEYLLRGTYELPGMVP